MTLREHIELLLDNASKSGHLPEPIQIDADCWIGLRTIGCRRKHRPTGHWFWEYAEILRTSTLAEMHTVCKNWHAWPVLWDSRRGYAPEFRSEPSA